MSSEPLDSSLNGGQLNGGGVGERDSGKLATSLDIASDLMEPNVCSGLRGAPRTDAMPTTESDGTKKGKGGGHGASARAGDAGSADLGQRAASPSSTRPSQLRIQRHMPAGVREYFLLFCGLSG